MCIIFREANAFHPVRELEVASVFNVGEQGIPVKVKYRLRSTWEEARGQRSDAALQELPKRSFDSH